MTIDHVWVDPYYLETIILLYHTPNKSRKSHPRPTTRPHTLDQHALYYTPQQDSKSYHTLFQVVAFVTAL